MQRKNIHRITAALIVAGGGLTVTSELAQATGTGTHGISRTEEANVRIEDDIRIKEKGGAQVIVAHITVQPRGHTPWHYHPGPHIVTVKTGTVEVYETDCTSKGYPINTGFFDPGETRRPHIHTLLNPSYDQVAEVVITDIRTDDPRLTVAADPQPAPCFT